MEYVQIPMEFVTHLAAFCGGMGILALMIGFAMWKAGKSNGED